MKIWPIKTTNEFCKLRDTKNTYRNYHARCHHPDNLVVSVGDRGEVIKLPGLCRESRCPLLHSAEQCMKGGVKKTLK